MHVAERLVALIRAARGRAEGARLAVLGWAYKGWPPTDDMRGAPVTPMLPLFRAAGLELRGHDYLVAPDVIAGLRRHAGVGRGRVRRRRRRAADIEPSRVRQARPRPRCSRRCAGRRSSSTRGGSSTRTPVRAGRRRATRPSDMARVLVLGGAGFIGAHLAARLADEGHALTLVDDLSRGRSDAVLAALCARPGVRFVAGRPHRARRAGRAVARSGIRSTCWRRWSACATSSAIPPASSAPTRWPDDRARLAARRRRDALLLLHQRGLRGLGRRSAWRRCRRPRTCRWRSPTPPRRAPPTRSARSSARRR